MDDAVKARRDVCGIINHAVGAVVVKIDKVTGEVNVLVMSYMKNGRYNPTRLFVGTVLQDDRGVIVDDEAILATLDRELLEEVAEDKEKLGWDLVIDKPVFTTLVMSDHRSDKKHLKIFYVIEVMGAIRTTEYLDGDEVLGVPFWLDIEKLIVGMEEGKSVYAHKQATYATIKALASAFPAVKMRYKYVLPRCKPDELSFENQMIVQEYLSQHEYP